MMLKLKHFKQLLVISCFSIHLAYSGEIPDIARLQDEIQTVSQRIRLSREAHRDTDSVIVIGTTGHGKSTLITHLAGRPMVAEDGVTGHTLNTEAPLPDFQIGAGVGVGTRMPSSWHDTVSNVVYWDCPGFNDPRGAGTDIVNAFSIQQLFQAPSQVKIVITVQESALQGRAENFGKLLNQVISTFPDDDQLRRCLSLVVTRQRDVRVEGALKSIYDNADQSEFFRTPRVKSLVEFLSDNSETRVSSMPYPGTLGAYVGNRESILRSIASANYATNPVFNISIPAESRLYVSQLLNSLNGSVVQVLRESEASIVGASYENILRFNGNSDDLRQEVRTIRDFVNLLGLVQDEREEALRFVAIPGLNAFTQQSLSLKIEQIYALKEIRGERADGDVFFATNEWFGGLNGFRQQLDRLWDSLQVPVRITKTPVVGAFPAPVSDGTVREEEIFTLPNEQGEKTTFKNLRATRSLLYTHEDQALRSIPREVYLIQRENGARENLPGNELTPVAYLQTNVTRAMVPGTLNLNNVSLRINRTYQRDDRSVYPVEQILAAYPIVQAHLRYDNNDAAHSSTRFVRCSATHEGSVLQLGDLANGVVAHTWADRARVETNRQDTGTHLMVSFSTQRTYTRPDGGAYPNQVASGPFAWPVRIVTEPRPLPPHRVEGYEQGIREGYTSGSGFSRRTKHRWPNFWYEINERAIYEKRVAAGDRGDVVVTDWREQRREEISRRNTGERTGGFTY